MAQQKADKASGEISKQTTGAWVYKTLENSRKASAKIEEFLKQSIEEQFTEASFDEKPTNTVIYKYKRSENQNSTALEGLYSGDKNRIYKAVIDFLLNAAVKEIFALLPIEINNDFIEITKKMVYAAACALTGDKEFANKQQSNDWKPNPLFLGRAIDSRMDGQQIETIKDIDKIADAVEVGAFRIKRYSPGDFEKMTGEKLDFVPFRKIFLDPYYRNPDDDIIHNYKVRCAENPAYCTLAYLRIALYWLKKLIDEQTFPAINDILRKSVKVEAGIQKANQENNASTETDKAIMAKINFFKKNSFRIDAGKIWTILVMAGTDGNENIHEQIKSRNYSSLNSYGFGVSIPHKIIDTSDKASMFTRKTILALAGEGVLKDKNIVNVPQNNPTMNAARDALERKYMEAAEDPRQYMLHSCHDMIVHDARGRMLRAFPTFYMLFIDEGREVGTYKLHDNFYNNMAISSIEVIKSRKIAADTANIVMSNVYQTFSTTDDDISQEVNISAWDTFKSVFFSSSYAEDKLEPLRQQKGVDSETKLRPGARIQIRLGYGAATTFLPIVFNGVIAEVTAQDAVEIVAQSDGIELMNPMLEEMEAYELEYQDGNFFRGFFSNASTPKYIVNHLFTNSGSYWKDLLSKVGFQSLFNRNPFGITHFGDPDFKELIYTGEPTQNIFEVYGTSEWRNSGFDLQRLSELGIVMSAPGESNALKSGIDAFSPAGGIADNDEAPRISFDIFGKTPWDIINTCASVDPTFICAVAPFGFRSTCFMGAPRFYYAYDYYNDNGVVQEKRKPFQQYHIYSSYTDIIGNGMAATQRDMNTAAVGLYRETETFNIQNQKRVGPLFADMDIYPENQKTMIVDTQLIGKGVPVVGFLTNSITSRIPWLDDKGMVTDNEKLAWKMTATALKHSMMDMYTGDIVMLGDPSVKPHDRAFIFDEYESITGQVLVKEVVMSMSIENGFTTTISPDCIVTVDDPFELTVQGWFSQVNMFSISHLISAFYLISAYKHGPLWAPGKVKDMVQKSFLSNGAKKIWAKVKLPPSAIEAAKKAGERITSSSAAKATKKDAEKAAGKVVGKAATEAIKSGVKMFSKEALKTGVKTLVTRGAAIAAAGTALGAVAVGGLPAIVLAVGVTLAIELTGSFVSSLVENFVKNLQVTRVYPVKKNGKVWTAGLGGSKGMIHGSPSEKQQGALQSMVGKVMGSDGKSPIADFARSIFFSDDTMKYASNLRAWDNETERTGDDASDVGADKFGDMLRTSFTKSNSEMTVKNDYRQVQVTPRVDYSKNQEVMVSYKQFAMLRPDKYKDDPKLNNFQLVSADARIQTYIREGFFKIVHETPGLLTGKHVAEETIRILGKTYRTKSIEYTIKNGNKVVDIPLLHPDAIHVLYEILRRTKNNMPAANAPDKYESYDYTKNSFLFLESALRIGDTESQAAAGFTFIIRGVDKAAKPLADAINEFHKELKKEAEESSVLNREIFNSKNLGNNKIAVVVRMPKIGTTDESEKTETKNESN